MTHEKLAQGRWFSLSLAEQLGNIGSEYERAKKWHEQNDPRFQGAFDRFLELLDLTSASKNLALARRRELLRLREVVCSELTQAADHSSGLSSYFYSFALLARKAT